MDPRIEDFYVKTPVHPAFFVNLALMMALYALGHAWLILVAVVLANPADTIISILLLEKRINRITKADAPPRPPGPPTFVDRDGKVKGYDEHPSEWATLPCGCFEGCGCTDDLSCEDCPTDDD